MIVRLTFRNAPSYEVWSLNFNLPLGPNLKSIYACAFLAFITSNDLPPQVTLTLLESSWRQLAISKPVLKCNKNKDLKY